MEAIILAGGKAERMGDATGGRPKSLVEVAERPLVSYQIARLGEAGVERVIVSCAAGQGELFTEALADIGPEIVCAEEPERLGRGGGIKYAARERREQGDVFAMNGDELAAERRLRAYRHDGLWLTVNTPKELRRAQEHVSAHPEWLGA